MCVCVCRGGYYLRSQFRFFGQGKFSQSTQIQVWVTSLKKLAVVMIGRRLVNKATFNIVLSSMFQTTEDEPGLRPVYWPLRVPVPTRGHGGSQRSGGPHPQPCQRLGHRPQSGVTRPLVVVSPRDVSHIAVLLHDLRCHSNRVVHHVVRGSQDQGLWEVSL